MPYKLRKAPKKDLYWVVTKETGKHHSKEPLPLARAKKQLAVLNMHLRGGEYPIPPPTIPDYPPIVPSGGEGTRLYKELMEMLDDPAQKAYWVREQKDLGKPYTDADWAKRREVIRKGNLQRAGFGFSPEQEAEMKRRDLEQQEYAEAYRKWDEGRQAYLAENPEEKTYTPTLDEDGEPLQMSTAERNALPQIDGQEFARRLELYRSRHRTGFEKFAKGFTDFATSVADVGVDALAKIAPGIGKAAQVAYKTFAPPGSQYYTKGTIAEKAMNLPGNVVSAAMGGRRLKGGALTTIERSAAIARVAAIVQQLRALQPDEEGGELDDEWEDDFAVAEALLDQLEHDRDGIPYPADEEWEEIESMDDVDDILEGPLSYLSQYQVTDESEAEEEEEEEEAPPAKRAKKGGRVSPLKLGRGKMLKGGAIPSRNILQQMAKASYSPNPPSAIAGFNLVKSTPTLKFYKEGKGEKGRDIVIAIRGTNPTDTTDLKADAMTAVNQLQSSARFQKDVRDLKEFQNQYPPSSYQYYGVGHSLGGAILDAFLKLGLLRNGVSYNPAVQPLDIRSNISNQRIYQKGDPLYETMGRFTPNVEVRDKKKAPGLFEKVISYVPFVGTAYTAYANHALDNFTGGKKPTGTFHKQLQDAGVSPEAYLKKARSKAKKHGLAYKHLGFSSDEKHKLQIPKANGSLVRFGAVGLGDHVLYSLTHDPNADEHRRRYLARATKIKGNWKKDPYSPNNLAIHILW
jgi:hypothetical protein